MAESIREPEPSLPLIRTRRVEVLDGFGRVRVAIGELPGDGPHGLPVFGLTLYGPNGSARADLIDDACGVRLSMLASGNVVLEVGAGDVNTLVADEGADRVAYLPAASDHTETSEPGPYVVLCDSGGATAFGWRVAPDGSVQRRRPSR